MLINSIEFILFIVTVLFCYAFMPKKFKYIVLLIASYIFYFLNSKKLIIFIIIATITIYFIALLIDKIDKQTKVKIKNIEDKEIKKKIKGKAKLKKKSILTIGIIICLGMLLVLKYTGFFTRIVNRIFNTKFTIFSFILPLGISYYTLQAISYIVDVYRGVTKADKNFLRLALFLSFFPEMVEGPIERYNQTAEQLYRPHKIKYENIVMGFELMLWGYFKKMVIADRIAMYANAVFNNWQTQNGIILLGIICYTIQIYAEFSGGIDIIRGCSELFGIELNENFKRPFYSKNVDEFWRRWNITLGTWLKDYIFYPVSLSKISIKITSFCQNKLGKNYLTKIVPSVLPLFCVWICNGFWHGSGKKYIIYGLYYFTIMMLGKILAPIGNKMIKLIRINTKAWSYRLWQMIRTFIFVCFGMLIFRADNIKVAFTMLKNIFTEEQVEKVFTGDSYLLGGITGTDIIILIISIALFIGISVLLEHGKNVRKSLNRQNLLFKWIVLYTIMFAIIIFGVYGDGYNPQSFIYGQF